MHIGILNGIQPSKSLGKWGKSPIDLYIRFLNNSGREFTITGFELSNGDFPKSPEDFDAFLITGSPRGVYDPDPWINKLKHFISERYEAGQKLVGICFGHQILAHSLGGHAKKSEKGWGFGRISLTISKKKTWMENQPDDISLFFVHQDQVTKVPDKAEILGGNDFVPNAIFSIHNQVLGIQGHPEFSKETMLAIASSYKNEFDSQFMEDAVNSIENGSPDNQLVAKWVANFLKS